MNKKTKIIYSITKASWGGAQKYVYDLATALPPDSYEVIVLLGGSGLLTEKLSKANIRTIILENLDRDISFFKDLSTLFQMIKIFRKERPDIIHLNSSKVGLLGALAGRLAHIPKIIFTGHGWAFNEDRSRFQKKILYFLHLLTIRLAHKTIAVSEQTKNQIQTKTNQKKIIVIKNGLNKLEFLNQKSAREKILEKISAIDLQSANEISLISRPWLGTIAELHKNKGLKYLIEAMHLLALSLENREHLPVLTIIGEGERRKKLEERIQRYGLTDSVFLIGRIDEAQKYLPAFDIFILSSVTEALPYVLLEAGQAGLPIIASNVGGIPEIIDDMENGILVRPKEPEEIKKALTFLLENKAKSLIMGKNIQTKILKDFSMEKMVKNTIKLYNE